MVGYEDGVWLVRWKDGRICREARVWNDGEWCGELLECGRIRDLDSSDAAYIAWKHGITRRYEYARA